MFRIAAEWAGELGDVTSTQLVRAVALGLAMTAMAPLGRVAECSH